MPTEPTTDATPRPWRMISVSDQNDRWTIAQAGVGHASESMFVGSRVRSEADAALIVEAVNSYDRLRAIEAAAREVINQTESIDVPGTVWNATEALRLALFPDDRGGSPNAD
jgi:hypothetical protein